MARQDYSKRQTILQEIKKSYEERGLGYIARSAVRPVEYAYYRFAPTPTFTFKGREYHYLYHPYNNTLVVERCVEVPIVHEAVENCRGTVLEIGNVLSHYVPVHHPVVDKFEEAPGVVNEDIVDYHGPPVDLVVSISTMEHVGYDEPERDPGKVLRAFENVRRLIRPGGRGVFTIPLGYNVNFDTLVWNGWLKFDELYYMKQISPGRWLEVGRGDVEGVEYGEPYPFANAVLIAVLKG